MRLLLSVIVLALMALPAEAAITLTVPYAANEGQYFISWDPVFSANAGAVAVNPKEVSYVLEESTTPMFIKPRIIHTKDPHATKIKIIGRPAGTYYYRVKAIHPLCQESAWMWGRNGVVVSERELMAKR